MLLSATRGAPSAATRQQQQPKQQQPLSVARPLAAPRAAAAAPRAAAAACSPTLARRSSADVRALASKSREEAEIAKIKAEAERDDPWSGDVAVRLVQVAAIIIAGAVLVTLIDVAQPLVSNTLGSFPSA